MGAELTTDWRGSVSSALEWWADAGVDTLAADEPRDWLAPPVVKREAAAAPAVAEPVEEKLPETLEAFLEWRLGEAAPEADWMSPRVGPAGPADSTLMILTDMPEADDEAALLGGAAGRLFDRMLAAIGESRDSVHLASLAVARPIGGRIPPEQEARLISLALHHIALVSPAKLLVLGQSAERVIEAAGGSASLNGIRDIKHSGGNTDAVMIRHPRFLLERPAVKADAWRQLLLLSRGTSQ
ncbi:uracil-DNA glycosylase family protein [Sphingomonas sp. AOB5]|uniref:uracil-DNA glycosylase family protein n=1 Tax=Sphingomonas sp. AOB5 TaxID=3034017 RepID=UPI0023F70315|nr:uracil-DNA glycosylase family protein [Sphingomonas sp. AOB5]MDF7775769.1 uracil-DNA glycosylase family protein [Sphingomonas sp. AOB5]